jgi:hypothetical protein
MIFLIDVIYVMIDYCHRHNQINQMNQMNQINHSLICQRLIDLN